MEHLAILQKKFDFTTKILNGQKTIESRWYKTRRSPWHQITQNDEIYFKNTGEGVTVKAQVENVLFFDKLDSRKIKVLLDEYGERIGLTSKDKVDFYKRIKDKSYGILIFLKNPSKIEQFNINKKGFGNNTAWISVNAMKELIMKNE